MKNCLLLHYGFEKPVPEIMGALGQWFESNKAMMVEIGGHFLIGREISKSGTMDLPLAADSIAGDTAV